MTLITLEIDKATDLSLVKKILTQLKFVKRIILQQDNAIEENRTNNNDIAEESDFYELSKENLSKAYSDKEPEYSLNMLKEPNPNYETR